MLRRADVGMAAGVRVGRWIQRGWMSCVDAVKKTARGSKRLPGSERTPVKVAYGALAAILALAVVVRMSLLARDVPTLDSDQSVVGLMALHLLRGEWSVYYWGQAYMGSLEAILVAPFLWLFGMSSFTLHLASLCAALAFLVTIYLVGEAIYSRAVGLVAAALLAVGPAFFVVWSVRTSGGYIETLLLGQVLLLLVLKDGGAKGAGARTAGVIGLVAGLALWTNLLVLPYLIGAVALAWLRRRADLVRGWNRYALVGGFALGVAPALVYNILNGGTTLGTILGLTVVSGHKAHDVVPTLPQSIWLVLSMSLPILCGTAFGGTQVAGYTPEDYAQARGVHPVEYVVAVVIMAVVLAVCSAAVVRIARRWRMVTSPAGLFPNAAEGNMTGQGHAVSGEGRGNEGEQWRMQGQAALLIVGVCYFAAFCLNKQFNLFATPRYLLPLYSLTPLVVGECLRYARRIGAWWPVMARSRGIRYWVGGAALLLLLAGGVYGCATLQPVQTAALDHGVWIVGRDEELLSVLRVHRVRTVISNDYWEGLRLTFESGESVIAVMVTPDGHTGFNRYQPYVARGLADPRPAYVELTGTAEAERNLTRLRAGQLPGYSASTVGLYTLLVPS